MASRWSMALLLFPPPPPILQPASSRSSSSPPPSLSSHIGGSLGGGGGCLLVLVCIVNQHVSQTHLGTVGELQPLLQIHNRLQGRRSTSCEL